MYDDTAYGTSTCTGTNMNAIFRPVHGLNTRKYGEMIVKGSGKVGNGAVAFMILLGLSI